MLCFNELNGIPTRNCRVCVKRTKWRICLDCLPAWNSEWPGYNRVVRIRVCWLCWWDEEAFDNTFYEKRRLRNIAVRFQLRRTARRAAGTVAAARDAALPMIG
jgi:hypothetical protein